jgi:hypothetical protein
LVSYDGADDTDAVQLGKLLASVGPVGAGINLEYFFSFVDNQVHGAGTKLPHNVVGFLGVINGSSSDLRTGLVEQMIEIHEPMRLLLVVEGGVERVERALRSTPAWGLVEHGWVLAAALDPTHGRAWFFDPELGAFAIHRPESTSFPTRALSADWYRGQRGCLPPVHIESGAAS